jgi:hypothetical protein
MSAVTRRNLLIAGALISMGLFSLAGCTLEAERQWYKPNQDISAAELKRLLQRDYAECTKNRVLDESCMRQRGWVSLSGDREPPARPQPTPKGGGPKY